MLTPVRVVELFPHCSLAVQHTFTWGFPDICKHSEHRHKEPLGELPEKMSRFVGFPAKDPPLKGFGQAAWRKDPARST